MHHSSPLISALPTLDSSGSQSNPVSTGVVSLEETNSFSSRKRRRPRRVERKRTTSPSSYSWASKSSSPSLGPKGAESSDLGAVPNVPFLSIRRSARVSATRRVRALDRNAGSPPRGHDGKDHYDADQSDPDIQVEKKDAHFQTDLTSNGTVPSSANKRERKRSRALVATLQSSAFATTTDLERGAMVRGRTKAIDAQETTPLVLNHLSTLEIAPPVNKKRSSSESSARTQSASSLKKAKNATLGEGNEGKSLFARGKASRWTPEEDDALLEGVSLYLKSKGLQVHPPSHLPTEKDVQLPQPTAALAATGIHDPPKTNREGDQQPLYRSTSTSSLSSLQSSSSSSSATYAASSGSRDTSHRSSSLWAFHNSNGTVYSSSSPSPRSSTSSVCTGSTLTSEINHTLSRVRLENSPYEEDSEIKKGVVKDDEIHSGENEEEDNATELFNRFVDSSSASPPLRPAQTDQGSSSFPAMHLPSSNFAVHQEPAAAFQSLLFPTQPQTLLRYLMAIPDQDTLNPLDWAWKSHIPHNNVQWATPFVDGRGPAASMAFLYNEDQYPTGIPRIEYQDLSQMPRERLRPLTPGEILAAKGSTCPSSGKPKQEQIFTSKAIEGETPPSKISPDNHNKDVVHHTTLQDGFQTQESYALAVSRTLAHCPWSSVVQASPRLAGIRTGVQAQARWSEALDPQVLKGPWTAIEDQLLMQRVEQFSKCWIWIADGIPGRTQRQCRTRWVQIQTCLERERAVSIASRPIAPTVKAERKSRKSRK